MWHEYITVSDLQAAIDLLGAYGPRARIVAGATDLILELERQVRTGVDILIDITRVVRMDRIYLDDDGMIHLGPLVTHNQCIASALIVERAFPLAQAAWEVGAPQIRNRGTIAGNLITASPANDTITPLMALDASVVLRSVRGQRTVMLRDFYKGVRQTVMEPDELLVDIFFRALPDQAHGCFIKIGLRQAQAISVVNSAVLVFMDGDRVQEARIALGSVAPVIIRSYEAEATLRDQVLTPSLIAETARFAQLSARPIDDIRGSAAYRSEMVRVSVLRALEAIYERRERKNFPHQPVLLSRAHSILSADPVHFNLEKNPAPILTTINDVPYEFTTGHEKTLLRLLREEAGLIGTKEGCAEGECGACTVILDDMAVMSCLVPAPRAHSARIYTIEGLAKSGNLHPVQQAFIDTGAVQCGYCTPGFIMSAAMLLDEKTSPTREDIMTSITGNLCRCTGYYKIIQAIEKSASKV